MGQWLTVCQIELKCWVFALLKYSKVELGGDFEILDPFNITSVPPRGDIMIKRRGNYV